MSSKFHQCIVASPVSPIKLIERWLDGVIKPARVEHKMVANVPYSPPALIREIFHKIPPINNRCLDTSICVLYTIEMAVFLSGLGFNNITVVTREHDPKIAEHVELFGYKYLLEQQVKDAGMKFDVVVGNPPYQDLESVNTKNLWPKFVDLSIALTEDRGHFALITPRTWATNEMYQRIFLTLQPIAINMDECAHHFPGVNSTFSYYVVHNAPARQVPVEVTMLDGQVTLLHMPPGGLGVKSIRALSITGKMETGTYFQPFTSYKYHTDRFTKNDPHVALQKDKAHPVEVLHKQAAGDGKTVFFANEVDAKQHGVPRVIHSLWVGRWRDMFVTDNVHTCQQFIQYVASSLPQAENLRIVLQSTLYTFLMHQMVSGGSLTMRSVSRFPLVDLSHSWTDQELYAHFNLTQQEIDLIEATVK